MAEAIEVDLNRRGSGLAETVFNYGILERVAGTTARQDLTWLAFGVGEERLRLVVDGPQAGVSNLLRGVKVGTTRAGLAWDFDVIWSSARRTRIDEAGLARAIAWAHQAPTLTDGPLSTPWSSHRDLLGFRHAAFFDAGPALSRVDASEVHDLAGGQDLPRPRVGRWGQESLCRLMRISGAILGLLPADRRSFRVFVHLARERGWGTTALAEALMLTHRRVRQLGEGVEPLVPTARLYLTDPRLAVVP